MTPARTPTQPTGKEPKDDTMDDKQAMHAMGLDDAYHIDRTLAHGPYGTTELVSIDGTGPFVRKKIPLSLARRSVWAALADCRSPRLPRVEATYELPDRFVVVYDYVEGETLDHAVSQQGRLAADDAVRLTMQICEAVRELHAHGLIHRDLSPSNVIVAADGAHLIDFGITAQPTTRRTASAAALGTFGFAAPEQYGFAGTDARCDIYAIGRLLGYMLTGAYPDDRRYERLLADDQVVEPRLRGVIERACAFEPSARHQRVDEFMADLDPQYGGGQSAVVEPKRRVPADGARPHARGRIVALVAASVAVIAVVVAVALLASGVIGDSPVDGGVASTGSSNASDATDGADDAAGDADDAGDRDDSDDADRHDADGGDVAANPLELAECGWSVDEQGYVNYAFALRNTDATQDVEFPEVTVTGRDADGAVVFSRTDTLMVAPAGRTVWFGAGAGNGVAPATVDMTVVPPQADDRVDAQGDVTRFDVADVNEYDDGFFTTFSGEVAIDADDARPDGQELALTLVLRDDDGDIVYGRNDYVSWSSSGRAQPFSIMTTSELPYYATAEVHARLSW